MSKTGHFKRYVVDIVVPDGILELLEVIGALSSTTCLREFAIVETHVLG